MRKKRMISSIVIFILGFVLASILFGFGTASRKIKNTYSVQSDMLSADKMTVYDGMYEEMEVEEAAEMAASNAMTTVLSGNGSSDDGMMNDVTSRKLIKTYHLSFETEVFDEAKAQLEQLLNLTGAYAESADLNVQSWNHDYRNYVLTIRVPNDKTEAFLNQSSSFGTLTGRSEQVEDVTLDYVDVEAHKKSLEVEYDRVVELLESAEDLEQILLLESKLSDLRYQLDSYESRLRTYDNLIEYTTIYLSIQEVHREQPKTMGERITAGFSESIENLGTSVVDFIVFFVSNSLLIAIAAVMIWAAVVIIRKILKRNKKNKIEIIEEEKKTEY